MMYEVTLVLDDGEIRMLHSIKLISWTRARIIFTDTDDQSYHFMSGRIIKCKMEVVR